MSSDLFDVLVAELGKVLAPLGGAVEEPRMLDGLLARIGATAQNSGGDRLATALRTVVDLADQLEQISAQSAPSFSSIVATLEASRKAFSALHGLSAAGGPAEALENFGVDLANLLITIYLWNWHPLAHDMAVLLALIEPIDQTEPRPAVVQSGRVLRLPFQMERLQPAHL